MMPEGAGSPESEDRSEPFEAVYLKLTIAKIFI